MNTKQKVHTRSEALNYLAKILCVLYDDPARGYPERYARDGVPIITHYEDRQTVPGALCGTKLILS